MDIRIKAVAPPFSLSTAKGLPELSTTSSTPFIRQTNAILVTSQQPFGRVAKVRKYSRYSPYIAHNSTSIHEDSDRSSSMLTPVSETSVSAGLRVPTGLRAPKGPDRVPEGILFETHLSKHFTGERFQKFKNTLFELVPQILDPQKPYGSQEKGKITTLENKILELFPETAHFTRNWPIKAFVMKKLKNKPAGTNGSGKSRKSKSSKTIRGNGNASDENSEK
ncbi:hypothetical protein DL96DRAFT_1567276 [Flagelloscypha sp. PMI_526]|nr:hypothetical protein DL96DRAFT_1567276 [Flagelloscypha sp. PMI_526]